MVQLDVCDRSHNNFLNCSQFPPEFILKIKNWYNNCGIYVHTKYALLQNKFIINKSWLRHRSSFKSAYLHFCSGQQAIILYCDRASVLCVWLCKSTVCLHRCVPVVPITPTQRR